MQARALGGGYASYSSPVHETNTCMLKLKGELEFRVLQVRPCPRTIPV